MQPLYGLEPVIGVICATLLLVVTSAPWLRQVAVPGNRVLFSGLQLLVRVLFLSLLLWIFRRNITVLHLFKDPITLNELLTMGMAFYLLIRAVMLLNTRPAGATAGTAHPAPSFLSGLPVTFEGVMVVFALTNSVAVMVAAVFIAGVIQTIFHKRIVWLVDYHKVLYTLSMGFYILLAVVLLLGSVGGNALTIPKTYIYFAVAFGLALQLAYIRLRGVRGPRKSDA